MASYLKDSRRSRRPPLSCPLHHSRSELGRRSGHYPNLSSAQRDGLQQIKAKLKAAALVLSSSLEDENLRLLRFLRAKKVDVNEAFSMIRGHVAWETEEEYAELQRLGFRQVLRCDVSALYDICPWWFQGVDKQARPILWGEAGGLEVWRVLQLTPLHDVVRLFMWGCAQLEHRLAKQCSRTGCNIDTAVVIIDVTGWNLGLATKEAFALIQAVADAASRHFPERLGQLIVINAPSVLSFAWKVISGFLDQVTCSKVQIFNHSDEWGPVLRELADSGQLPCRYGGSAVDLTRKEALVTLDTLTTIENNNNNSNNHNMTVVDNPSISTTSLLKPVRQSEPQFARSQALTNPNGGGVVGGAQPVISKGIRSSTLSPPNLTIISTKHRHREPKNSFDTINNAKFGTLGDFGRWLSDSLRLTTQADPYDGKRRRHRRRYRIRSADSSRSDSSCSGVSDEDGDSEVDGDSSVQSSSTNDSRGSSGEYSSGEYSSGNSSVYDGEGGNVIHCRREDNLIPLPSQSEAGEDTSWMESSWMFDASTQTDISSFDPRFVTPQKLDIAKKLFTSCLKRNKSSSNSRKEKT